MISALIFIPWILTLAALLFIIVRNSGVIEYEEDLDDFIVDEDVERLTVAVYDDRAYWVHNNVFYESDVTREPDFETARPIDTMSMSQKDLTKLAKILDDLEEYRKE